MEGGDAGVATWAFCQFALSGDIWWESTRGTRGATPLVNPYPPPPRKPPFSVTSSDLTSSSFSEQSQSDASLTMSRLVCPSKSVFGAVCSAERCPLRLAEGRCSYRAGLVANHQKTHPLHSLLVEGQYVNLSNVND